MIETLQETFDNFMKSWMHDLGFFGQLFFSLALIFVCFIVIPFTIYSIITGIIHRIMEKNDDRYMSIHEKFSLLELDILEHTFYVKTFITAPERAKFCKKALRKFKMINQIYKMEVLISTHRDSVFRVFTYLYSSYKYKRYLKSLSPYFQKIDEILQENERLRREQEDAMRREYAEQERQRREYEERSRQQREQWERRQYQEQQYREQQYREQQYNQRGAGGQAGNGGSSYSGTGDPVKDKIYKEMSECKTEAELRSKYRNCAKRYHPDNENAADDGVFVFVSQVYEDMKKKF